MEVLQQLLLALWVEQNWVDVDLISGEGEDLLYHGTFPAAQAQS